MQLSIIIVNYNSAEYLIRCVVSFGDRLKDLKYEIIVVDNGSNADDIRKIKKFSKRENFRFIREDKNIGFGRANNVGLKIAKGEYVLFLNPDTLAGNIDFKEIITWMKVHPRVGAITCQLRNEDGTIQGTGGYFPTLGRVFAWMFFIDDLPFIDRIIKSFHPHHPRSIRANDNFYKTEHEIDWITGAFYFTKKEALADGFDEDFFMYGEDVDLSKSIVERGYKIFFLPKWNIIHLGGKSSNKSYPIVTEFEGLIKYYKKYMPKYQITILKLILKAGIFLRRYLYQVQGNRVLSNAYGQAFSKI